MQSDAKNVSDYIASLPPERQAAMQEVRKVILENLPEGYQETMDWGMISYEVPLEVYPDTYNKKPLSYCRSCITEELHGRVSYEHLQQRG